MKNWLKMFWKCLFKVCTIQLERDARELRPFDLVSMCENPDMTQLYMIYSMDRETTYFLKWMDYGKRGVFDANIDYQVCYENRVVSENLYKISNFVPSAMEIFYKMSRNEMYTFATRLEGVFARSYPACGWFVDDHKMRWMILCRNGDFETGTCVVINLNLAVMVTEENPVAPITIVQTRNLLKYNIHCIGVKEFSEITRTPFHPKIYKLIADYLLAAIKMSEAKINRFPIYAKGVTTCSQQAPGKETVKCTRCS